MKVQPFKVGLDYIDPGYHSLATGRQGENLDGFLMSEQAILEAFQHSAVGSDIAIVEGVRGLYEGLEALSDIGSTAQIAKLLKTPVVLVLDAQSITRSTAAIVKGYKDFDRGINFKGVILNKVGSDRHAEKATAAIQKYTGVEVLGAIPRNKGMSLTMRHSGSCRPGRACPAWRTSTPGSAGSRRSSGSTSTSTACWRSRTARRR